MVYYCGRKEEQACVTGLQFCFILPYWWVFIHSQRSSYNTYTDITLVEVRIVHRRCGRYGRPWLVCVCCCGLSKLCAFGCLIGSSGKHRFKWPARQPVTTVRDWRCWRNSTEEVIGLKIMEWPWSVILYCHHSISIENYTYFQYYFLYFPQLPFESRNVK